MTDASQGLASRREVGSLTGAADNCKLSKYRNRTRIDFPRLWSGIIHTRLWMPLLRHRWSVGDVDFDRSEHADTRTFARLLRTRLWELLRYRTLRQDASIHIHR